MSDTSPFDKYKTQQEYLDGIVGPSIDGPIGGIHKLISFRRMMWMDDQIFNCILKINYGVLSSISESNMELLHEYKEIPRLGLVALFLKRNMLSPISYESRNLEVMDPELKHIHASFSRLLISIYHMIYKEEDETIEPLTLSPYLTPGHIVQDALIDSPLFKDVMSKAQELTIYDVKSAAKC